MSEAATQPRARYRIAIVLGLAILAMLVPLALMGRKAHTDYSARFVRYGRLVGGQRVAVVVPLAHGDNIEEQTAYCGIDDLKPGETVYIRVDGKSWDVPADAPEREVVSRAEER